MIARPPTPPPCARRAADTSPAAPLSAATCGSTRGSSRTRASTAPSPATAGATWSATSSDTTAPRCPTEPPTAPSPACARPPRRCRGCGREDGRRRRRRPLQDERLCWCAFALDREGSWHCTADDVPSMMTRSETCCRGSCQIVERSIVLKTSYVDPRKQNKGKKERGHMLLLDCACACGEKEESQEQADEVDEGVE